MQSPGHITKWFAASLILVLFLNTRLQAQDDAPPTLVEIIWQSSKTIVLPGVTNLTILDPDIASAEVTPDNIRFIGLARGETLAIGYYKNQPISIGVRVLPKPMVEISPSMRLRQDEMGQGSISSNVQTSSNNGTTAIGLVDSISWSQLAGRNGHLDFAGQMEQDTYSGGHAFNLRTASIVYYDPTKQVRVGDFSANIIGSGPQGYVNAFSFSDTTVLRGGSFSLKRGKNEYDLFAGTTVPYYYLTLGSTRDLVGFTFSRKESEKLGLFATTSFLNSPINYLGLAGGRRDNVMQTAGFTFMPNRNLTFRVAGGESNHGGMLRGEVGFQTEKMTAYASGILSSVLFPSNQLGSLFTGTDFIKGGWTYRNKTWLTESINYQHVVTEAVAGITTAGSSDYLSPSAWVKIGQKQDLNVEYDYSHNVGGFSAEPSTGNRVDSYWHYQLSSRISNTAQITVGSVQDPLQLNSENQFTLRDSVYFPIKDGSLGFSVEHDKTNTSLVEKLQSELNLLSPALQTLFLADPIAFVNSTNLPPEIRALLDAQQPIGTSVSASGQFHAGRRLDFGPTFSMVRSTDGATESWSPFFSYGLRYQMTRTLQLTSSLSNVWVLENSQGGTQHTQVFSFGITKSFSAAPSMFRSAFHHGGIIEGRVFRDTNVNGVFNAGERGFDHIRVELDTGETVVTDELGRYRFEGVSSGQHHVMLDLGQFPHAVRMTTASDAEADLIRSRVAVVNFGVVDFARLVGSVFNDLRFEGKRQPDSIGMPEVRLTLDDGKQKRPIVTENGDFELVDLSPGDYIVSVDTSTVPANYISPKDSYPVRVGPISTTLLDVPLRALRSIAGHVYLKVPQNGPPAASNKQAAPQAPGNAPASPAFTLVPLAGIHLRAADSTAVTDPNGNFLLRDLPAGDLTVSVVPLKTLPPGMQAPSGAVHMPAEPIQVQGGSIVIGNPDLVPYLVGKTVQELREAAIAALAK
jgi:hypothetical protein